MSWRWASATVCCRPGRHGIPLRALGHRQARRWSRGARRAGAGVGWSSPGRALTFSSKAWSTWADEVAAGAAAAAACGLAQATTTGGTVVLAPGRPGRTTRRRRRPEQGGQGGRQPAPAVPAPRRSSGRPSRRPGGRPRRRSGRVAVGRGTGTTAVCPSRASRAPGAAWPRWRSCSRPRTPDRGGGPARPGSGPPGCGGPVEEGAGVRRAVVGVAGGGQRRRAGRARAARSGPGSRGRAPRRGRAGRRRGWRCRR